MDERSDLTGAAGWHPDPVHRFEFRYFNGQRWTADVAIDGRRYVDDLDLAASRPDTGWHSPSASPSPSPGGRPVGPPRTQAVMALVFGLGGLAIAWAPFLFVVGGLGAIAALILGGVALRRIKAGEAAGRGLAVAGMIAGVAALGLCVVGVILTGVVVREYDEYIRPGPVTAHVTTCQVDTTGVTLAGTVDNLDDRAHDYIIVIEVTDAAGARATAHATAGDVAAGRTADWHYTRLAPDMDTGAANCRVLGVNGPYPFGLQEP